MRFTLQFGKNNYEIIARTNIQDDTKELVNKLGQLEDVEEELGIDLITLFKAFSQGIYVKELGRKTTVWKYVDDEGGKYLGAWHNDFEKEHNTIFVHLKDYGKTWALTKEELE